jgi:ribosomal peptide maturation radical SAM protein 1
MMRSTVIDLRSLVGRADVLLVIPPFGGIDRPSLGAHLLQACALEAGVAVDVFYANLELATRIGERAYEAIAYAPSCSLVGERIFARAAYGVPPLGRDRESILHALDGVCAAAGMTPGELEGIEQTAGGWAQEMAERICAAGYRVVGCSTTFEQTAASVALLQAVKKIAPATVTLLGGANCDGLMAEGVVTLNAAADFVFRGESERTFVQFLQGLGGGTVPPTRIVSGEPCADLDALPAPDFTQFFRQVDAVSAGSGGQYGHWLTYESSRGCWWGEKRHCTFCGLNAEGMATRRKSAERVIADLRLLRARHGPLPVCLTDNIMPYEYFRTLLPRLQQHLAGITLFYEIKANLSLAQVRLLVDTGVRIVQPGIEALSTRLLQTMRKGVTGRQNLALLRYARACGLELRWNLLYGLPGDCAEDYEEQLALMPWLRHLEPPQGLFRVTIDRFSPYHFAPEQFGIGTPRPANSYLDILPETASPMDVAYHFDGEFASESRDSPELIARLHDDVAVWRNRWSGDTRPVLAVMPIAEDHYLMVDTRAVVGCDTTRLLDHAEAAATLVCLPMRKTGAVHRWARQRKLALELDDWHIGLATAEPGVLERFERSARSEATARSEPQ